MHDKNTGMYKKKRIKKQKTKSDTLIHFCNHSTTTTSKHFFFSSSLHLMALGAAAFSNHLIQLVRSVASTHRCLSALMTALKMRVCPQACFQKTN